MIDPLKYTEFLSIYSFRVFGQLRSQRYVNTIHTETQYRTCVTVPLYVFCLKANERLMCGCLRLCGKIQTTHSQLSQTTVSDVLHKHIFRMVLVKLCMLFNSGPGEHIIRYDMTQNFSVRQFKYPFWGKIVCLGQGWYFCTCSQHLIVCQTLEISQWFIYTDIKDC